MATETGPDLGPAGRRRAAEILGVPEDASPAQARRACLGKLRESDFLPPRSWHQALRVLDGGQAPARPDEDSLAEEEARLHAEVASLADEFFTLPAGRRRERWDRLLSRSRDVPPLVVRLQGLKAGLDVEPRGLPQDGSPAGPLAEHLLETFPLPPLARAASRQAFLRQLEESSAEARKLWEKAARYLRAEWPAVAALDEELVQHVASLSNRLKRRRKMHRRCQQGYQPAAPVGVPEGPRWRFLLIVIGVALGVLRGFINSDKSSPRQATSPGYSASRDGEALKAFNRLRGRTAADPKTGVRAFEFLPGLPPIDDLLDPSKYDLELEDNRAGDAFGGSRVLHFTPRPGLTAGGPIGRPVEVLEGTLRLMGVPRERIDAVCSRAAGKKPRDSTPGTPRKETDPKAPKSAPGDRTRP